MSGQSHRNIDCSEDYLHERRYFLSSTHGVSPKTTMASMAAAARTAFTNAALISLPKSSKIESVGFQSFQPLNFRRLKQNSRRFNVVKASASGLYSAENLELTVENVDKVLDNVRPYLITDGGNVDVVSVDNGVVSLKLQGKPIFPCCVAALSNCFLVCERFCSCDA